MIPAERCLFLLPKDRRAKSKVPTEILWYEGGIVTNMILIVICVGGMY